MDNKNKDISHDLAKKETSRRDFLKKAAYSAPVLIVMGQLVNPTEIHADGTGGPTGTPGWNVGP